MTASRHRTTVIASGLLCCVLILVVLFTSPAAFRSPVAVLVMALIGTAAVLVQLRVRNDDSRRSAPPLWLNIAGILFSLAALFPATFHLSARFAQPLALAAVSSFAISSAIVLHSMRRRSNRPE